VANYPIQIRWADLDANRHVRHSAYYDYAAQARIDFMSRAGLDSHKLEEWLLGPILFREECVFRKEIRLEDQVYATTEMLRARHNFSRWALRHQFYKNENILTTVLTIEGAWLDLQLRKLAAPNAFVQSVFASFPRAAEFQWMDSDS
jgi:acyl-CoA thioester hydrolase